MRRLLKFRVSPDEGVLVKYERSIKATEQYETITLESTEKPTKDQLDALGAMAAHLVAIAELPAEWKDELEIRSVTVTHTNGITGLVITALRKLKHSNAPLVLNSPHFTEAAYSETGDSTISIYSHQCGEDLETLTRRVMEYVDGEREQLQLKLEQAPAAILHGLS